MLNRKEPPPFRTIGRIDIHQAAHEKLGNGIELFKISAGSQEITRLEFVFRAGMYHQPQTLVASGTNTMLESGTRSFTANQLSEGLDFYGSYLELQVDQDYATVTLFALNKFLEPCLRYIAEMLKFPSFPEEEFRIHVTNKRQKHAINARKVNVVARRKFAELLFGPAHPYGRDVSDADFDRLTVNQLKEFFDRRYHSGNCTIIASGNLPAGLNDTLDRYFGGDDWRRRDGETGAGAYVPPATHPQRKNLLEREDAIQSAIRVGRLLFNKTHPDYFHFQVLNTVLGGYFGSRLMANIREDKGYTYGIGSGLNNLVHGGYFFISTEVGCEVTAPALEEIYREIMRLREEPIGEEELETVRNYMLGNFLRSVDGPFALAEKFRNIWEYGLGYDFYEKYFHAVKTVKPQRLQELAQQYLAKEMLLECVVGKT